MKKTGNMTADEIADEYCKAGAAYLTTKAGSTEEVITRIAYRHWQDLWEQTTGLTIRELHTDDEVNDKIRNYRYEFEKSYAK